jgi:DNA-binding MarR family transcriptional regulator
MSRTATIIRTPRQEAMVALLQAAGRLRRALEDVCDAHGLTHDQYNVLRILRGAEPDGLPRFAIAERLIDRAPDVTRLLDRLEREDWVERTRSTADRRLSVSRITRRGLDLLTIVDPEIRAVHERLASGLHDTEVRQLRRLLGKLPVS